ncbi:MAG: glycosyltransferase [Myxococcales bacterium]|nr:glycosyltransferase [Myxococcales bacterium]
MNPPEPAESTARPGGAAPAGDSQTAQERNQAARLAHWNQVAAEFSGSRRWSAYYHRRLAEIYRHLIPLGSRVLELGCAEGDLLAALEPEVGVGVDFSEKMLALARDRHPELRLIQADVHDLEIDGTFDVIILSDLVNDLWDIQAALERILPLCTSRTRIIVNCYSRAWQLPFEWVGRLGLARPTLAQNWVTAEDLSNLLDLSGFEVLRSWGEILCPLRVPGLNAFLNRFLGKLWPIQWASMTNFILARPVPRPEERPAEPLVSIIVAARNEEGNIAQIFERTPELGGGIEFVFVEGGSSDDTFETIRRELEKRPEITGKLLKQPGKGKGDAVRAGFAEASGDIFLILDADLSVAPEDLPRFVEALRSGRGEFINGVRLVYPMEERAMRFFNLLGNKFFSLAFSWLLGQPIKDTLCGTKVLWREDYERIAANRSYFGEFDPFGDYDLIFGAARLNLRIVDVPIRYRERTYGAPNISRWRDGQLLLRMVLFAARRLKFV